MFQNASALCKESIQSASNDISYKQSLAIMATNTDMSASCNSNESMKCNDMSGDEATDLGATAQELALSKGYIQSMSLPLDEPTRQLSIRSTLTGSKEAMFELSHSLHSFFAALAMFARQARILIDQALALLTKWGFAFIFISSYRYYHAYMTNIAHDNHTITQYFRHVDARRLRANKRRIVLPIRYHERRTLAYPFQLCGGGGGGGLSLKKNLTFCAILVVFACVSLCVEWTLHEFLSAMVENERHLQSASFRSSSSSLSQSQGRLEVKGSGYFAKQMRILAAGMAPATGSSEDEGETSAQLGNATAACLPRVYEPDWTRNARMAWHVTALVVVIFVQLVVKRLNRIVCAVFYRKREKRRILWLYNETLRKRLALVATLKRMLEFKKRKGLLSIKKKHSLKDKDDDRRRIRQPGVWSTIVEIVRRLVTPQRMCVLCEGPERASSIECVNCSLLYCAECWLDLAEKCAGCTNGDT